MRLVSISMMLSVEVTLTDRKGQNHIGIVQSIEREDGSGYRFNVKIGNVVVYIHCQ